MRHRVAGVKLGRTPAHRQALLRNLVTALLEHEVVRTTDAKAKELRRGGAGPPQVDRASGGVAGGGRARERSSCARREPRGSWSGARGGSRAGVGPQGAERPSTGRAPGRVCRGGRARERSSWPTGSGGIGSAQGAQRPSTGRAPGRV